MLIRQVVVQFARPAADVPQGDHVPVFFTVGYFRDEIEGVIDGGPCELGRESTIVSLTPTGRKKMEAVCERSGRLMEAVRQKFGEEKLAELKLLLEEMVDVTAAALAEIEEAEE